MPIDDAVRSPFAPYGLSGIMLGASIVFFAYIGFDSISTHAEEARNPQRDVPIGIIVSLLLCTVLYMAVAAVITGMVPYPKIDDKAPIADAFAQQPGAERKRRAPRGHGADRRRRTGRDDQRAAGARSSARPASSWPCRATGCCPRSSARCIRGSARRTSPRCSPAW